MNSYSDAYLPLAGGVDSGRATTPDHSWVKQCMSVVRRRKWLLAAVVTGALLIGLVVTLLMTPLYTAEATIEIQRESRNFINVEGAQPETSPMDLEFYETQYGLLEAKSLGDRVAEKLQLYDNAEFFQNNASAVAARWFENGRVIQKASTRSARIEAAGAILLKNVSIAPQRLSRLVGISYTSSDPAFSKRVVDAWSIHFIEMTLERRFEATSYARKFLEGRLAQLRERIDESERKLVSYAAREGIINLPATTSDAGGARGERSLLSDDLTTLNQAFSLATADRIRAESRLQESGSSANEAIDNQAMAMLRQRRAEVASEYSRLMTQFEPNYPPARALMNQVNELDRALAREEGRVRRNLTDTVRAARDREEGLRQRVDELKTGVLDLRRRSIEYNIYQRDVDTNRQLYEALLQRYKEIGVAGGVGVNNISVVDPAELPERPSSPKLGLILLASLVLGLAAGIGAVLLLEQLFEGISDPAEAERVLGLPLIGLVPKEIRGHPAEVMADRKSSLSEAYMTIQTSLSLSTAHGVPATLAVTSTRPSEGKTTASYSIALVLARSGRRTLLVDVDMRSPSIHDLTGVSNNVGLSNYLAGSDDLSSLIAVLDIPNLSVMAAGPPPPSASELLAGDRFDALIADLLKKFDNIVFDLPPVMGLADAPLVASRVEGTLFVIEAHSTRATMAGQAIARLRAANIRLVGTVLTKFDVKRSHYSYGYDYGYGYGYGTEGRDRKPAGV